MKIDEGRALVYRAYGAMGPKLGCGVQEVAEGAGSPKIQQLKTHNNARLISAGLAYGTDQPPHVDNRLFCGDDSGFFYTFPLSPDGKTRTQTEPTPYRLVDADSRPVIDIAVHSQGTCVYALVRDRNFTGNKALLMQEVKGPPPYSLGEHPTWDVVDNPYFITKTDNDKFLFVTSGTRGTTVVNLESGTPKFFEKFTGVPLLIRGTSSVCVLSASLGEDAKIEVLDPVSREVSSVPITEKFGRFTVCGAQGYNESLDPSWLLGSSDTIDPKGRGWIHLISMTSKMEVSIASKEISNDQVGAVMGWGTPFPSLLVWGK
ncbi:hypothetical protein [Streptomyces sp. YGL11-2]|uniref:hypothetical protein n=1 Tax=Streptomyces sp. YGL11-2 TaxID=3414028 RepID=UPI003CF0BD2C